MNFDTMNQPMEILITNDDGIQARGIRTLAQLMSHYGNVTVVAPKYGQSGKGTALTMDEPLRFSPVPNDPDTAPNIRFFWVEGSPVDCVKMAIFELFQDRLPDLLMSGINHGTNSSAASVYSGTLGACQEGALYDIPSIGFSIDSHSPNVDFSAVTHFGKIILDRLIRQDETGLHIDIKPGTYVNVNFPKLPIDQIKGIRLARQGRGQWIQEFDKRQDPHGRTYYWMCGLFQSLETDPAADGDHVLLQDNWVTLVPHRIDNTDYAELERYRKQWE